MVSLSILTLDFPVRWNLEIRMPVVREFNNSHQRTVAEPEIAPMRGQQFPDEVKIYNNWFKGYGDSKFSDGDKLPDGGARALVAPP